MNMASVVVLVCLVVTKVWGFILIVIHKVRAYVVSTFSVTINMLLASIPKLLERVECTDCVECRLRLLPMQ